MIYKTDTFVIDTKKITYMAPDMFVFDYWDIHFVGGSQVSVRADEAKRITNFWEQESQKGMSDE